MPRTISSIGRHCLFLCFSEFEVTCVPHAQIGGNEGHGKLSTGTETSVTHENEQRKEYSVINSNRNAKSVYVKRDSGAQAEFKNREGYEGLQIIVVGGWWMNSRCRKLVR